MAFLGSFDISASGMSAQRVRMDIAAENIANMDTTRTESGGPYRRKNVLLESYSDTSFAQAMEKAARGKGITSRHAGVRVSGIVEDDREAKKVYNPGSSGCGCRRLCDYAKCGCAERNGRQYVSDPVL